MKDFGRFFYALFSISIFIFSLQLLSSATEVLAPVLRDYLKTIAGPASSLGAGWLGAYLMLNGSTVAAMSLAFLKSGIFSSLETFMVVSGSRLGASFIVVLIGAIEYFEGKNDSLRDSTSIGLLAFLVTYSTYLPAIGLGYLILQNFSLEAFSFSGVEAVGYSISALFQPLVSLSVSTLGNSASLLLSIVLLFGALRLFDTAFADMGQSTIRENYIRFLLSNRWYSLAAGALMTFVTTSVSLSLGLVVPLYNQGFIKRKEIIPYMMGANITTLADTLMAAAVLESSPAIRVVLLLGLTATVFTMVYVTAYDRYYIGLKKVFDRIITDTRLLGASIGFLILAPLILIFLI